MKLNGTIFQSTKYKDCRYQLLIFLAHRYNYAIYNSYNILVSTYNTPRDLYEKAIPTPVVGCKAPDPVSPAGVRVDAVPHGAGRRGRGRWRRRAAGRAPRASPAAARAPATCRAVSILSHKYKSFYSEETIQDGTLLGTLRRVFKL